MSDLSAFLLARIAEDESLAQSAAKDENLLRSLRNVTSAPIPGGEILHIVRWDPARVLAECEAKRSLINIHPEAVGQDLSAGAAWAYDEMLRRLALPYADHPDYRQEWRP